MWECQISSGARAVLGGGRAGRRVELGGVGGHAGPGVDGFGRQQVQFQGALWRGWSLPVPAKLGLHPQNVTRAKGDPLSLMVGNASILEFYLFYFIVLYRGR